MMREMEHLRASAERRRESRRMEKPEGAGSRWALYFVLLIASALVFCAAIPQFSLRFAAPGNQALQSALQTGALAEYESPDARAAVALCQQALHARAFLLCGAAGALAGAGLLALALAKARRGRALFSVLSALLLLSGALAIWQGARGLALQTELGAGMDALRKLLDIGAISAQARLPLWQGALYHARFALAALALALLITGARGLWRARAAMRLSRDKLSVRGYKRTVTVFILVVLLYAFAVVAFLGAFNTLGAFTNAAGLGDALNAYGRRAVTQAQEAIRIADKDIKKAEGKLAEAQKERDAGEQALAAAGTEEAIAAAEKALKSANKDIEKQTKKITEARAERAQAVLDEQAAQSTVTVYGGYSVKQLFALTGQLLPYRAQYGTELDKMYAAFAQDFAAAYGLNDEEFTVLARKAGGYNLTQSDLNVMRWRYLILAVGLAGLLGVILFARAKRVLALMFKHAFLTLIAFISVFPFYWVVISATNTSMEITLGKLRPGTNLLVNFVNASFSGTLGVSFANSLRNALVITVGSLLVSSAAGYGFVVYQDKGKDFVMKLIMLSMMIPAAATLIPLFKLFSVNALNLLNTTWAVVLPGLATAFLIFMFRQGAQSFPRDLIEAARIDGMSELGIFLKMFIPVMRPTYAAAATVTFMNAWNAYLWPLVALTNNESQTMPIYIANILEGYVMDFGQIMLAVTISTLPTVIIFFFLQKSFVEGIIGSVKQ